MHNNPGITLVSLAAAPVDAMRQAGVKLEGCYNSTVSDNVMTADNPWAWWLSGVRAENSTTTTVISNSITGTGCCISFHGTTNPGYVKCNSLISGGAGVYLENSDGIGDQGEQSNCTVYDNLWYGTFATAHTGCYYSFGSLSPFNVRTETPPSGATYIPTSNWVFPLNDPFYATAFTHTTSSGCAYACGGGKSLTLDYETEWKIAANQMVYGVNPEENEWMSKQYVYNRIMNEPAMLQADTVFVHFRDSVESSTIGKLYAFNQLLSDTTADSALVVQQLASINNSITPVNTIEENHKNVNQVYIDLLSAGTDSLTPSQHAALVSVAQQCPYIGGNAVYSARVILSKTDSTIYSNECEINSNHPPYSKLLISATNSVNNSLVVYAYPNPAKNELTIVIQSNSNGAMFELFDILGKKLLAKHLPESDQIFNISLSDVSDGIYYYQIENNGKIIYSDKLIIIK